MTTIAAVILFFQNYQKMIVFLGSVFGGEETILIFAFFSGQKIFSFTTVLIFSILGTIVSDSFWYFLGRRKLDKWIEKRESVAKKYKKLEMALEMVTNNNHIMTLLATKFLYGTRILTIMHLSKEKLGFRKFSIFNTVTIVVWAIVIVSLGHVVGENVPSLSDGIENARTILFAIAAFIAITIAIRAVINMVVSRKIS